ncbi:MAG: hypothetical protein H6825_01905 [Planctomycetes bacterium]|nr:hypothetical protein [Planctomycetota bacterium]
MLAGLLTLACSLRAQQVPWVTKPTDGEMPLPSRGEWDASLVYESDVGIWTVGTAKPFERFGAPEVYGLDDKGRCTILSSYSGRWTPTQTTLDGKWLGSFSEVDLDPQYEGAEIYTGGQNGRLYELHADADLVFDVRVVARLGAEEIHTTVAGDLLPSRPGNEMLLFTRSGQVWDVRPPASAGAEWSRTFVAQLRGRVRQAVTLPAADGDAPWIACATRPGQVLLLRMTADGLDERVVTDEPMGFGRIALRKPQPGLPNVLYATRDDGLLVRLEERADSTWAREPVYAGPMGLRGVAAGRFDEDPTVESVIVFGYSHKLQHLWRHPGQPWQVETIFVDRDKGHWLSVAELDGRNATDEVICSGYGGRIVLLARPPGYGMGDVATDPDPTPRPRDDDATDDTLAVRVAGT